jgi:acetate kinase
MDTTLTVNPGSSSKKYALFKGEELILSVLFEHVGDGYGKCVEVNGTRQRCEETTATAYEEALDDFISVAQAEKVIERAEDIKKVGVRIVSPGTFFTTHRVVDEGYLKRLEKMSEAAPLHIPHQLEELRSVVRLLPNATVIGVSDSAFHSTIPAYVRSYSIPRTDAESFDTYRFGYHGLSVASVMKRVERIVGEVPLRAIVCHVGSGVSVTAVKDRKGFDTTMGFGPGSGLMMNTRAGELDPSALFHLMRAKKLSPEDMERYVSTDCGLSGMLGQSDLRVALDRYERREHDAVVAIMKYAYGIKKAIGAFVAALGGIDTLILTATAAERNPTVRSLICDDLAALGIVIDTEANESLMEREGIVSTSESPAKIAVVRTDEMREIARVARSL